MNGIGWLTALWAVPMVGAAVIILLPATARNLAKYAALAVSLAVLAVAAVLAVRFDPAGAQFQFVEDYQWIPSFGTGYILGIDGIALALVVLTAVLVPLLIVAGWNDTRASEATGNSIRASEATGNSIRASEATGNESGGDGESRFTARSTHSYLALMLAVEAMVLISLVALDVLLFYVFFEAMLIPLYFLIGGFGGANRSAAAVKFLLYNLFGGLIMLAAVIGLYVVTAGSDAFESGTFDFRAIVTAVSNGELNVDPALMNALFLGFMFAFAVKAPLWPFHRWLPDAAVESTPSTAVLMMAVVDKVGTFGMLRYCLQLFPDASKTFQPFIITLAVIGIVYGAILAIGQTDVMRLIAYTSISHFGFIILGIFAMTSQGQSGSTLYMVNHGISTAALFLIAGFLVSRRGTRLIADFGGVQKVAPVLAGTFLVAGLATLSLPGLAPFISEFLVLIGTFSRFPVVAVFAALALVLSAVYILWAYQRMMTGPVKKGNETLRDLLPRELIVVTPLIALLLVLGVYPKPVLDVINPAVTHTLTTIDVEDPSPAVAEGQPR